jgi:hypothetical protein
MGVPYRRRRKVIATDQNNKTDVEAPTESDVSAVRTPRQRTSASSRVVHSDRRAESEPPRRTPGLPPLPSSAPALDVIDDKPAKAPPPRPVPLPVDPGAAEGMLSLVPRMACPHCGNQYPLDNPRLQPGIKATCAKCKTLFTVPVDSERMSLYLTIAKSPVAALKKAIDKAREGDSSAAAQPAGDGGEELRAINAKYLKRVQELEKLRQDLTQKMNALGMRVEELEGAKNDAAGRLTALQGESSQREARFNQIIVQAQGRAKELEADNARRFSPEETERLKQEAARVRKEVDERHHDLDKRDAETRAMAERVKKEMDAREHKLQEEMTDRERRLKQEMAERERALRQELDERNRRLETKVEEERKLVSAAQADYVRMQQSLTALAEPFEAVTRAFADIRAQAAGVEVPRVDNDLRALEEKVAGLNGEWQARVAEKDAEIAGLRKQTEDLDARAAETEERAEKAEREARRAEQQIADIHAAASRESGGVFGRIASLFSRKKDEPAAQDGEAAAPRSASERRKDLPARPRKDGDAAKPLSTRKKDAAPAPARKRAPSAAVEANDDGEPEDKASAVELEPIGDADDIQPAGMSAPDAVPAGGAKAAAKDARKRRSESTVAMDKKEIDIDDEEIEFVDTGPAPAPTAAYKGRRISNLDRR